MRSLRYGDDEHYDVISAFIKSIRGSDPDAGVYWLARMLEAGEDARFIARRLVILASEDVGMADPMSLLVADADWDLLGDRLRQLLRELADQDLARVLLALDGALRAEVEASQMRDAASGRSAHSAMRR